MIHVASTSALANDRVPVEGKPGNAKRKGTLQQVIANLAITSRTVVTIGLIALDLDALLRFSRAMIRKWSAWQALMMPKYRAPPHEWSSQATWICTPSTSLLSAA